MILALRALSLSVGIGGLTAIAHLPAAIYSQGSVVLLGYVLALLGLALPAWLAEMTAVRIHCAPLLATMFWRVREGRVRPSWVLSGGLLVTTLLLLATLACYAAAILGAKLVGEVGMSNVWTSAQTSAALIAGFWLLLAIWVVTSSRKGPERQYWEKQAHGFFAVVYLVVTIPGLFLFSQHTPDWHPAVAAGSWGGALAKGAVLGVMSSMAGLGIVHGQLSRNPTDPNSSKDFLLVLLTAIGVVAWSFALIGWALALAIDGQAPLSGMALFTEVMQQTHGSAVVRYGSVVIAMLVLFRSATVMLEVLRTGMPGSPQIRESLMGLLVVAVIAVLTAQFHKAVLLAGSNIQNAGHIEALLRSMPSLLGVLIPLTALAMMSVYTRSLPPAPMIWAQRAPLPLAAALYLHWRYSLRLVLLALLFYNSGLDRHILDFWLSDSGQLDSH